MGDGLDEVKKASSAEKNIVVSPAALECARYLEKTFGTPYELGYPLAEELVPDMDYDRKKDSHRAAAGDSRCYKR